MPFDSLDNFLINLSFQVNSEILPKNKEGSGMNTSKLSKDFHLKTIIYQMLSLVTNNLDRHKIKTKMEDLDFKNNSLMIKSLMPFVRKSCRAGHETGGVLA